LERCNRVLLVQKIRRAHMDDVRPFGAEHRGKVVVGVAEGQGLRAGEGPAAYRDDLTANLFDQRRKSPSYPAAAHNGGPHGLTLLVLRHWFPLSFAPASDSADGSKLAFEIDELLAAGHHLRDAVAGDVALRVGSQ